MTSAIRPHVAFVVANFPPHVGGVERHVAHLAPALDRIAVSSTVFALEPRGERDADGTTVVGLGRNFDVGGVAALPDARAAIGLVGELRDRRITHVSVHTRFFPATWLGIWAGHRLGLPIILTEHGGGHAQAGGRAFRAATRAIDLSAGRTALRRADRVLAVSDRSAEFVRSLSGRDATVCGNGVDYSWWTPREPVVPAQRLVFVGRLVAEKGWRDFLSIVHMNPGWEGVILGDGPDLGVLRAEVSARGLSHRVEILGRVSPEVVQGALGGAVYVNASTASEGLQTTLLEAAAGGARIATYDVGGAAEARAIGATIMTAPVGDLLLLSQATRAAIASVWREPVGMERFSWQSIAQAYRSAIEDTCR